MASEPRTAKLLQAHQRCIDDLRDYFEDWGSRIQVLDPLFHGVRPHLEECGTGVTELG
jgi:hypothetical protein